MPKFNKQYWLSNPYKKTVAGSKSENYGEYHLSASESKDGKRCPLSVIKFNYDTTNIHPTQKPVALCRWLIETYTDVGDTVLDNCMGSGSTGVACMNVGRKFIGIELDSKYYNIAKQRIETAERPLF